MDVIPVRYTVVFWTRYLHDIQFLRKYIRTIGNTKILRHNTNKLTPLYLCKIIGIQNEIFLSRYNK